MAAMDACNARFGRGSVVPARAGLTDKRTWSTKFEMRRPLHHAGQRTADGACEVEA